MKYEVRFSDRSVMILSILLSTVFWGMSLGVNPLVITGVSLWALTLYLSFARLRLGLMATIMQWLDFDSRSPQELTQERPQPVLNPEQPHAPQREFWASLLSIIPFLVAGGLCYYGIVVGLDLGQSWGISFGIMGALISGIYELARASGASD
ncbi:MAG: hypothetical protein MH252_10600 [Thermosynechococcaceae cyanobacterium MS004]|nr:hypothetical protein [Thermosynechococcaceae cyanobacterium MS004]